MIAKHFVNYAGVLVLILVSVSAGYFYKLINTPKYPHMVGHIENVLITDAKLKLKARLDTGANTSSLSAHDIETFKKSGKTWVRFVLDKTRTEHIHQFEYPLKRRIKVRKRAAELVEVNGETDPFEHRMVVEMPVCLGDETRVVEVSLTDRQDFNYPVLLGRQAMDAFSIVIDPGEKFVQDPVCEVKEAYHEEAVE